mmetsp:Transcript_18142/g.21397  ORF Transcript_18142/g.21397 Transcript_18142/m.21397 type:complete len:109 (-) Transcript_18142:572-898(-)
MTEWNICRKDNNDDEVETCSFINEAVSFLLIFKLIINIFCSCYFRSTIEEEWGDHPKLCPKRNRKSTETFSPSTYYHSRSSAKKTTEEDNEENIDLTHYYEKILSEKL